MSHWPRDGQKTKHSYQIEYEWSYVFIKLFYQKVCFARKSSFHVRFSDMKHGVAGLDFLCYNGPIQINGVTRWRKGRSFRVSKRKHLCQFLFLHYSMCIFSLPLYRRGLWLSEWIGGTIFHCNRLFNRVLFTRKWVANFKSFLPLYSLLWALSVL